jgi:tetratricopeptide (TPR) repeat protein
VAAVIGHDKVFYYPWHGGETAIDMGFKIPAFYRDETELAVVTACPQYLEHHWTKAEWRHIHDLIFNGEGERVLLTRTEKVTLPGLVSSDIFLNLWQQSDDSVVAAILTRLGVGTPQPAPRTSVQALPIVDHTLIGREKELEFLDKAWADPKVNIVQIVAPGGTGKTALMDSWYRKHRGEATIFGWSFYSQGTDQKDQTSSDRFFNEVLPWLGVAVKENETTFAKVDKLAERLRREKVLLILDGVEPLQNREGDLRDAALQGLLMELEHDNAGMVLITTRVKVADIEDKHCIELDNLSTADGVALLRHLKVDGTDEELEQAVRAYGNHALALTLLGTYIGTFCESDIRRLADIQGLEVEDLPEGEHARKVMRMYEAMYAGEPELDILKALGYFNRPAEPEALKLVFPAMGELRYRAALQRLRDARLVLTADATQALDCHPLIREHFAKDATQEGHAKLYEHYKASEPEFPDTIEEMVPLFHAVYHGCQAGKYQDALDAVYFARVLRGGQAYLNHSLGANGTDLSMLAHFFAHPWLESVPVLKPTDQSWVIGAAGYALRALGRMEDAVEPLRVGAAAEVKSGNAGNAATAYRTLSELHLILGQIKPAIAAAQAAIEWADQTNSPYSGVMSRDRLASALHASGDRGGASRKFHEAERTFGETVYGLDAFQFCDFLLDQGQNAEVLRRAASNLSRAGRPLSLGLDHLSLGRAHQYGSAESIQHLNQAVEYLRRAGHLDYLPLGLLARGTQRDLEEAFRIATRSKMRLYLADYHLISARNEIEGKFGPPDSIKAREHYEKADQLIQETGYHRRDQELEKLKADLEKL